LATSAWWKEQRHGVFVDYNQNARDRTTASAYSVRPVPDARVSMPLQWDEVADVEPADFTLTTVPAILRERGDAGAGINASVGDLTPLLELADRDEAGGLGDAPWPPHFPKAKGEPDRVAPSRAKKKPSGSGT
jgi:DNA primase